MSVALDRVRAPRGPPPRDFVRRRFHSRLAVRGPGGRVPPASPRRDGEPVRGPQRPLSRRADCVGGGRLRASPVAV